ncbi:MAG: sortase [Lachnospiraceae bacterium]|nr:sortase [Lachnospiraceae bacterium]
MRPIRSRLDPAGKKVSGMLVAAGIFLICCAGLLAAYNACDDYRAGLVSAQALSGIRQAQALPEDAGETKQVEQGEHSTDGKSGGEREYRTPLYVLYPDLMMPTVKIDGTDYIGTLEIPSLELDLPVISEWSYPGLRKAPARYGGSAYRDDLVIAAHNYERHFGRLAGLKPGDELSFTDMDGNRFHYYVLGTEYLDGTDVSGMEDGNWDLSLFTCTKGGRLRLTVRCMRDRTRQ